MFIKSENDEGNDAMNTSLSLWILLIIEVLLFVFVLYKAFTSSKD
jgi:hypothetical protein